jgi:alpha-L-fucosidase
MKINGEGIYGSKAWKVFAEGETLKDSVNPDVQGKIKGMPGGKLDKIHADFSFSTKDFRFTEGKDGSVYAFCMTVPKAGETIQIKSMGKNSGLFGKKIEKVSLLGSSAAMKWKQEDDALVITCPEDMTFANAVGFKIN